MHIPAQSQVRLGATRAARAEAGIQLAGAPARVCTTTRIKICSASSAAPSGFGCTAHRVTRNLYPMPLYGESPNHSAVDVAAPDQCPPPFVRCSAANMSSLLMCRCASQSMTFGSQIGLPGQDPDH